jgi:hypothetical protein
MKATILFMSLKIMLKIKYSARFLYLFSTSVIFSCLLLNLNTIVASAQDSGSANNTTADKKVVIPDLNQLSVPDSPALDLIGQDLSIKPSETPRAFGLNLLESISNSEGNFPQNLAIEFAPYWWSSHPGLKYDEYYSKTGFGEAILETLSFSIGGTDAKIQQGEDEVDGTRLGLGLRFNLLAGQKNPALTDLEPNLERELKDLKKQFLRKCVPSRDANLSTEEVQKQIDECVDKKINKKWSELLKEKATQFGELQKLRAGWQLEFATAGAFDFPKDNFDEAEFSQFGTWLTTSYRGTKIIEDENEKKSIASPIQFLGVAKYSLEKMDDNSKNLFDLGAGIVYQLNQTPLALSLEYVRRFGDEGDDRLVGVAEYRINNNYTVFASYGKTFEDSFKGDGDLVTLFGLKIGAGKNQVTQELLPSLTPSSSEN